MRTLILYVFHEFTDNVRNFIRRGLVNKSNKEFIFISNGANLDMKDWKFLDSCSNLHLFLRQNIGHDFGGWNDALFLPSDVLDHKIINSESHKHTDSIIHLHTLFDTIIFLNSTVDGPYIPDYCPCDWIDCFTSKLSDTILMTGITANFMHDTPLNLCQLYAELYKIPYKDSVHIQSMAFSLNRIGLNILMKYKLFTKDKNFPVNKWLLICSCEIGMSSLLRHEGYSLFSLMKSQDEIKYNQVGDTDNMWVNKYPDKSGLIYPLYELIFVKTTPDIIFHEKSRYDTIKNT
jgi:hypothetical protein